VLEQLRATVPECREDLELIELSVLNVQYKPHRQCLVLYSLKYRNGHGRSRKLLLSGWLLPALGTAAPPAAVEQARSFREPFRSPVIPVPALGMTAYAFPLDPELPMLPEAMDPTVMKRHLGRMWKGHGVRVRKVQAERIGYTPGQRAALRYDVRSEFLGTGLPEARRLVGKIDAKRDAAQIFARCWSIWRAAAGRPGFVSPVGHLSCLNLYLQEWVDGLRLSELAGSGGFAKAVRYTARSVALLHQLRPHQRRRIRSLRDRLAAELERRALMTGPIHGDLHPSNILVDGDHITLIDLDNTTHGDRLLDVGRFLSALRTSSVRVHGTTSALSDAGEAFLEHYLGLVDEDRSRARLFEAAALLTSAGSGFRLQRVGWQDTADQLLEEAERVLGLSTPSTTVAVTAHREAPVALDREAWALDEPYVLALLAPHIHRVFQADLTSCKAEWRRGNSRRGWVRYRVRGWRNGSRWHRSLEGFLRRAGSGRSAAGRLAALSSALEGRPGAPLVPRSVVYLAEIGLHVVTAPRGIPIAPGMDMAQCDRMATRLVRALEVVHGTPLALDRSSVPEDGLAALRNHVGLLPAPLALRARPVLEQVEEGLRSLPARNVPVLQRLAPAHVVQVQDCIGLPEVEDAVLSHPLVDVSDFLGRLALLGLQHDNPPGLARLGDGVRRDYPWDHGEMALFEAATLLRLACGENRRQPGSGLAASLLSLAARAVGASPEAARRGHG
jgi:hypothetical protein